MKAERLLQHFDRISEAPDAIPRLRQVVLELAVRGKLVPQDPGEEPVAELLKWIQAEKERLVKEGEIKKLEKFAPVEAGEIPFAIPSGWQIIRMGWLARKLGAGSTPLGGKTVYQSEGVPFLRSQNVHDNGLRLGDVALIPRAVHERMSGTHVQQHDVLLNITGASIGRCALVPSSFTEGNVSQHVAIIRLFAPEIRSFVHLSLTSPFFQKLIDDVQVGVSREGLSMQRLKFFPMPLPPLAEQHRIVAKVDELMALCDQLEVAKTEREQSRDRLVTASLHRLNQPADTAEGDALDALSDHTRFIFNHLSRLTTHPAHIKQLRQTILNLAVRGKLVEQDPNDEPASELLQQIAAERDYLVTNKKIRPTKLTATVDMYEWLFTLPVTWRWARLPDLCHVITDGEHLTPAYAETGVPILSAKHVGSDSLAFEDFNWVSQETAERCWSRCNPEERDILVVSRGGGVGRTIISGHRGYCLMGSVLLFKPASHLNERFLCCFLNSNVGNEKLRATSGASAQQAIYIAHLKRDYLVPLPPLAEQHRIVAKVNELMALCDRLEAQLTSTEADSRRLLEAVLHEALVPALEETT